jgi:hypothetical protein
MAGALGRSPHLADPSPEGSYGQARWPAGAPLDPVVGAALPSRSGSVAGCSGSWRFPSPAKCCGDHEAVHRACRAVNRCGCVKPARKTGHYATRATAFSPVKSADMVRRYTFYGPKVYSRHPTPRGHFGCSSRPRAFRGLRAIAVTIHARNELGARVPKWHNSLRARVFQVETVTRCRDSAHARLRQRVGMLRAIA